MHEAEPEIKRFSGDLRGFRQGRSSGDSEVLSAILRVQRNKRPQESYRKESTMMHSWAAHWTDILCLRGLMFVLGATLLPFLFSERPANSSDDCSKGLEPSHQHKKVQSLGFMQLGGSGEGGQEIWPLCVLAQGGPCTRMVSFLSLLRLQEKNNTLTS